MRKFKVNKHGVVEDPINYEVAKVKGFEFTIHVAFLEGYWFAAKHVVYGRGGTGGLPSPRRKKYYTKGAAVLSMCEQAKDYITRNNRGDNINSPENTVKKNNALLKKSLKLIDRFLSGWQVQLSLFGD